MKKNFILALFIAGLLVAPMVSFAQAQYSQPIGPNNIGAQQGNLPGSNRTLSDLVVTAVSYLNKALALLMGLAVVAFVWYVFKYFITPNDKRAEGAQYLMWSLIGFFVILSMWGLVNILIATFDLGANNPGSWGDLRNLFPR